MKLPNVPIRSRDNQWYRRFRDAAAKHKEEIILEGPKQLRDAIDRGWEPIAIATSGPGEYEPEIQFSPELLASIGSTGSPQGVIGLFSRPPLTSLETLLRCAEEGPIVVLDGVQDPGNAGTIVRLAAAFGAAGIISVPGTADLFAPKTLRASAGMAGVLRTSVAERADIVAVAAAAAIPLFGAAADGTSSPLPSARCLLVMGSEGQGIGDWPASLQRIGIPMAEGVESLNVAAAAAILLHESFVRRQHS